MTLIILVSVLSLDVLIVVGECLLCAGLLINALYLRKKNKKLAEMVSLQKDRIREEKLDAMLQNQRYMGQDSAKAVTNNPYDVTYHEEDTAVYEENQEYISVQIEEKGVLSTKKYVIHVFDHVEIGSADTNKIILNDVSISGQQIQLLRSGKRLFAKNLDTAVNVILKRMKKSYALTQDAICIQSGDGLEFGNTTLRLTLI